MAPRKSKAKKVSEYKTPKVNTPKVDYQPHCTTPSIQIRKVKQRKAQCGVCKARITRLEWPHHNLMKHNNLAWIYKSKKPDFSNQELLKETLRSAIKQRKGNLSCELCESLILSVKKYLSHVKNCGNKNETKTLKTVAIKKVQQPPPSSLPLPPPPSLPPQCKRVQKKKSPLLEKYKTRSGLKRKNTEIATTSILESTDNEPPKKRSKTSSKAIEQKKLPNNTKLTKLTKPTQKAHSVISKKHKQDLDEIQSKRDKKCSRTSIAETSSTCNVCEGKPASDMDIWKHAFENHKDINRKPKKPTMPIESKSIKSTATKVKSEYKTKYRKNKSWDTFTSQDDTQFSKKMFELQSSPNVSQNEENHIVLNSFQSTLDFEQENYALDLFEEYSPNLFRSLDATEAYEYIPKLEHSMLTKSSKVDNQTVVETEWRTWTRFEGQCIQGIPTFFTGGPVWAISWLPIPTLLGLQEDVSEFLAISTHLSMDKEYLIKQTYSGKNIIQIWDVKNLRSKNLRNPELAYAIVHEGGTIWCLEWCPSGCYELASLLSERSVANGPKRMGLLAAACSDGCVRIYSLVFPKHLVKSNTKDPNDVQNTENKYPLYDTKPVLVLVVHRQMYIDNKQTWHVTKISWTKEKGHNIIAGGFSNGYVGLWDLSLKSPLSKFEKDDITFLMPFRHFFAHQQVVTMVYLIPVGDKRFLATAGMDRCYKFWDLEDVSNPKNYIKKSFITDGSWLDNWFCAFITGDDALKLNRNFVYCLPIRDYTYKYYDVLPMNSTSYSISANNFGNSVASGTLAGEVVAMFPHQLINLENMRKILHQKRHTSIFSSIDVVDFQENEQSSGQQQVNGDETTNSKTKNKIYTYMPSTYVESEKRFGLTFRDKVGSQDVWTTELDKSSKKTFTCAMMDQVPAEQYPFAAVNRVAWNPNARNFQWLAIAYQNGFVRCIPFPSLDPKNKCNELLERHIIKQTNSSEVFHN